MLKATVDWSLLPASCLCLIVVKSDCSALTLWSKLFFHGTLYFSLLLFSPLFFSLLFSPLVFSSFLSSRFSSLLSYSFLFFFLYSFLLFSSPCLPTFLSSSLLISIRRSDSCSWSNKQESESCDIRSQLVCVCVFETLYRRHTCYQDHRRH